MSKRNVYLLAVAVVVITAIVSTILYRSVHAPFACRSSTKILRGDGDVFDMNLHLKSAAGKATMTVNGKYFSSDGHEHNLYSQGAYRYEIQGKGSIKVTLTSITPFTADRSEEHMNSYVYGVLPGESRNFRLKWINKNLLLIGTDFAWVYACTRET